MKVGLSLILLAIIQAPLALGLVTKKCPETIKVSYSEPAVEKWYAEKAYLDFFAREKTVSAELTLQYTYSSKCSYQAIDPDRYIYSVVLKGTFRQGSSNVPTMIAYMNLPISGLTENSIGSAVAYSRLTKVTKQGIEISGDTALYYRGEMCSWGDCIPDHVYLGSFGVTEAK